MLEQDNDLAKLVAFQRVAQLVEHEPNHVRKTRRDPSSHRAGYPEIRGTVEQHTQERSDSRMNEIRTLQFRLEPDSDFPCFQRLHWKEVQVSLQDVLRKGIHPWSLHRSIHDVHGAFVKRLNLPEALVPALAENGYSRAFSHTLPYRGSETDHMRSSLQEIQKRMCFVDNLSYLQLLQLATGKLRQQWQHQVVKKLLDACFHGFADMRAFLKHKNPGVKLSGYADIANYDLAELLELEDFAGFDRQIIWRGIARGQFSADILPAGVYRQTRAVAAGTRNTAANAEPKTGSAALMWPSNGG